MKPVPELYDDTIDRLNDIPRILEALRLGVQDALRQHKQAGNPISVWRDGQVVWLAPEDIPVDVPSSDYKYGIEAGATEEEQQASRHARPRRQRSPVPVTVKAKGSLSPR